jgi:hypothetical protein
VCQWEASDGCSCTSSMLCNQKSSKYTITKFPIFKSCTFHLLIINWCSNRTDWQKICFSVSSLFIPIPLYTITMQINLSLTTLFMFFSKFHLHLSPEKKASNPGHMVFFYSLLLYYNLKVIRLF